MKQPAMLIILINREHDIKLYIDKIYFQDNNGNMLNSNYIEGTLYDV